MLTEALRPLFAGRKVVVTGGPLAAMTGTCRRLLELGAERPFLLATGVGTGEVPGPDEAEWLVVKVRAADIIAEIRAAMRLLRLLPAEVLAALDRWDPEREALVLSPMFNELPRIADRRVYGPRRPEWRRLEDKVVVDALWDDLGVTRAPSEVVAAEPGALAAAARRLDRGAGTAWAGDASQGFNGGAHCVRWVRSREDAAEAAAFLAARCDRARVMPFLEGVPCSIHGMVFPDAVATFRPVELVTLRKPGSNRLHYAGAATFWDPPAADREAMRDLPVALLDRALIEGEAVAFGAVDLERQVLAAADQTRAGGAWTVTAVATDATSDLPVRFEGGTCRPASAGGPADGVLSFGPSGVAGFVRLGLDPDRIPAGPPVAPLAVAAFALADERFGTGIGPLEPARAVR